MPSDAPTIAFDAAGILDALQRIREPLRLVREGERLGVLLDGAALGPGQALLASLPPLFPEWLGDRTFCEAHRVRFPYVVGEMANELTSVAMVVAAARAGFLAFFGAAGLTPTRIGEALQAIEGELGAEASWGSNLIHSPSEPGLEDQTVDLYLRRGVRRVSASAYMQLTPAVVRYSASGLHRDVRGRVRRKHLLFAKISRPETARLFLSPAPKDLLDLLVTEGQLTREEAELAAQVPMSEDLTVEADSGGHTDNRPLSVIFPVVASLRDELAREHGYQRPIRLGAAGGLGTPASVAAAFTLGAAYVLTGSVNQVAVESGLGAEGKKLLSQAGVADVMMAPAADMFELGVRVQVLRRGTLFGPRAQRLWDLYEANASLEAISDADRSRLESEIFRAPLSQVWRDTEQFWKERDPRQLERAARDPKHKMALCLRSYLGQASRWAIRDELTRRADFQIWTGPAIGAFNDWVRGSFLADPSQRTVAQIGLNLLEGAAVVTRAQLARSAGVPVGAAAFQFRPRPLS
jgi:PfaD family protein